ncbi:MAG TPA: M4 family metallopeptidase [Kofleriaceae bacterium]|nr:M4 family metallopeptidase [Kofleriaceae bacterium]
MKLMMRSLGCLGLAIVAGCQSEPAPPGDDPGARDNAAEVADIEEALAALPDVQVLDRTDDGVPRFLAGSLAEIGASAATDDATADAQLKAVLAAPLAPFLLQPDELVLARVKTDDDGSRHFRYQQVHDGLDVVGSELIVHVDPQGTITAINGTARGDLDPTLGSRAISEARALEIAAADPRLADSVVMEHRLVYVQPADGGAPYQAYELMLQGAEDEHRFLRAFVDVDRAAVAEVQDLVDHAKARAVYDAQHEDKDWEGYYLPGPLRRYEGGPASGDPEVNTAFDNLGVVYDAYKQLLQRDSHDNQGGTIAASVHYGESSCESYFTWYWSAIPAYRARLLVFGDGDGTAKCQPQARALDVVAHEFAHWVTYNEVDLNGSGEPDAINEGLSDIFGAMVEAWSVRGQNGNPLRLQQRTWTIGETARDKPIRDLCDPKKVDARSLDRWDATLGSQDPHFGGSVAGLAFCLLARGGSHPRAQTQVNVTGIGMLDAVAIFYKAQRSYMVSNTNYAQLRTMTEQAAAALGFPAQVQRSVSCAWAAVGVGTASQCGTTDIIWRATSTDRVSVWTMNGAAATGTVVGNAAGYQLVGTGDFDGDGKADILWRSLFSGELVIWRMNGGTKLGALSTSSPLALQALAVGDFDGNGISDILWRDPANNRATVWFMEGATKLGEAQPMPNTIEPPWQVAAIGDFNGDRVSDILWRRTDTGRMTVWMMKGALRPDTFLDGTITTDWVIAGTGRFNNDGHDDILWRNSGDGQVAIWFVNGGSRIGEWYPGRPGLDWQIKGTGDFNADGTSDILWRNNGGANAIWLSGAAEAAIYPPSAGVDLKIAATGQLD